MLSTVRSKVVALLVALGLGAGLVVTLTSDGCSVKPVAAVTVDAGQVDSVPVVDDAGTSEASGQ